jgi:hypothetical protein
MKIQAGARVKVHVPGAIRKTLNGLMKDKLGSVRESGLNKHTGHGCIELVSNEDVKTTPITVRAENGPVLLEIQPEDRAVPWIRNGSPR